ncbi:MAG: hypothetical protein ACRD1T_13740 [Acidimicrobiia bacterium]
MIGRKTMGIAPLTVALHYGGVHTGFDGGWIGPIVVVLLIVAGLALASRSKGP